MSFYVFAQFKISDDKLKFLSTLERERIEGHAKQSGWIQDSANNWLSDLISLPEVQPAAQEHVERLELPWKDPKTKADVRSRAVPQLVLFDVYAEAQRGENMVRWSGQVSDEDGRGLYLFPNVPTPLANRVQKAVRERLGKDLTTRVLAHRIEAATSHFRSTEVEFIYSKKSRSIKQVRGIRVYDHQLTGHQGEYSVQLRSRYEESSPQRNQRPQILANTAMRHVILHALSCHRDLTYSEGNEQDSKLQVTDAARECMSRLFPTPPGPVPPPIPPPVPPPIPPPVPPPVPPSQRQEQVNWSAIGKTMVVDDEVLRHVQAAVESAQPLLLTGAPGTGKTMLATAVAEAVAGSDGYTLVTADSRWTSTDVVGGLRIQPGDGLNYRFAPGIVTRAVQRHLEAVRTSGQPHVLIIDEFNRANQDEAFGRLLTLLDAAYRQKTPLVDESDGAESPIFLPEDFILIATMNDADVGRLHEIGAALSRRFIQVPVGIPSGERVYVEERYPDLSATTEQLYAFVGTGKWDDDVEAGRLRAFIPLGTHFMLKAMQLVKVGLTLDEALLRLVEAQLEALTQDQLMALLPGARRGNLSRVAQRIDHALRTLSF